MPEGVEPFTALAGHPIHLQCPALTLERVMTMPRIVRPLEDEQRPVVGRDLGYEIFEVCSIAQEAKPATRVRPVLIEIEQHGDDLILAVSVDLAILGPQPSAQRIHLRLPGEINSELLCDGSLEFGTIEFIDDLVDR